MALGALAASTASASASDTVLVKVDADASARDLGEIRRDLSAGAPTELPGGWRAYPVADGTRLADAVAAVRGNDAAATVALPTTLRATALPNDPMLSGGFQWGLNNTGIEGGTAGLDLGVSAAWAATTARRQVVVAVIDTGVQTTHPDLVNRIWTNTDEIPGNGVDDDGNGYVDDVHGWDFRNRDNQVYDNAVADTHGTHVAGIIAAEHNNATGVAGVAPNAVVMPLKFIGAGDEGGFNSDAAEAIHYAVDNGATVINGSFGGDVADPVLCDAVAWAAQQGVTFVAAAGNEGLAISGPNGVYPAACTEPTMITVGAVDRTGAMPAYSNRSQTVVDVAGPGSKILSTTPDDYRYMTGTSMATPMVAGMVAVLKGENASLTPAAARQMVMSSVTPLAALSGQTVSGGMVSLSRALSAPAVSTPADTQAPDPFTLTGPADQALTRDSAVTLSWSASRDAAGVAGYEVYVDGNRIAQTTNTQVAVVAGDGAHTWQVKAVDPSGNSRLSNTATFRVDSTAPTTPILKAPAVAGGTVTVSWSPSADTGSGVRDYTVLVDGAPVLSTGATTATAPVSPGSHQVVVRVSDNAGNVASSAPMSVAVATTTPVKKLTPAQKRALAKARAKAKAKAAAKARALAKARAKAQAKARAQAKTRAQAKGRGR